MIVTVLGRRGSGKSTLVKRRIAKIPRLLIFDTLAEYEEPDQIAGYGGCRAFTRMEEFVEAVEAQKSGVFRLAIQPINVEVSKAFEWFLRISWAIGNHTIVLDEIDMVSSPNSVPHELARNLNYGRHLNIDIFAASRRPASVPRLLTSQSDELIVFNTNEPRDVKYIEEFATPEFSRKIQTLQKYQYATYSPYADTDVSDEGAEDENETS